MRIHFSVLAVLFQVVRFNDCFGAVTADLNCFYRSLDNLENLTVVRGRVSQIRKDPLGLDSGVETFNFRIGAVLYGKGVSKGQTISFVETSVAWPETVAPFREGTSVILVLQRLPKPNLAKGMPAIPTTKNTFGIDGVLPTADIRDEQCSDRSSVIKALKLHLTHVIEREKEGERLRELILLLSGIADRTDVVLLSQFTKHQDEWVARAAKAALVRASPDARTLSVASKDLAQALKEIRRHDHVTVRSYKSQSSEWRTYGLLFTHYRFLGSGCGDAQRNGSAYLPLNRLVATDCKDTGYAAEYGIRPICRCGSSDDAAFLERFLLHEDAEIRKLVSESLNAWTRKKK